MLLEQQGRFGLEIILVGGRRSVRNVSKNLIQRRNTSTTIAAAAPASVEKPPPKAPYHQPPTTSIPPIWMTALEERAVRQERVALGWLSCVQFLQGKEACRRGSLMTRIVRGWIREICVLGMVLVSCILNFAGMELVVVSRCCPNQS